MHEQVLIMPKKSVDKAADDIANVAGEAAKLVDGVSKTATSRVLQVTTRFTNLLGGAVASSGNVVEAASSVVESAGQVIVTGGEAVKSTGQAAKMAGQTLKVVGDTVTVVTKKQLDQM